MDPGSLNWLAILAAALSAFLIGGLWYSPLLFQRTWQKATGLSDEQLRKGHPAVVFGGSFVLALVAAIVLAMFLGPKPAPGFAIGASLAAGIGWVATSFGINYLFERKPFALFAVNAGYHVAQYGAMGVVLGFWH
jgi:hypothetical protein